MMGGRAAVCADEEPNCDVGHDLAPMPGLAVADPPKDGANVGTDAGAEEKDYPQVCMGMLLAP